VIIGAIVLVVATAATTFVIVDRRQSEGVPFEGKRVAVIVSKQEIPANQLLDPLIEAGVFVQISVPNDTLVAGAVTDVRDLNGATTVTPILANEQITGSRLTGGIFGGGIPGPA
jgi:Flp pilus assembly protein CpaB